MTCSVSNQHLYSASKTWDETMLRTSIGCLATRFVRGIVVINERIRLWLNRVFVRSLFSTVAVKSRP